MSNPFNEIRQNSVNNNSFGYVKSIYQAAKNSRDPMQYFQMMARQNPRLQPILNMMNQGQNPQQVFFDLCKQRGINPEEFLKMLNS